jgi:hypothetical protein
MAIKGHRYSALIRCWYYRELAGRPIERFAPLLNLLFDLLAIPGFLEHHNPKHSWLASQERSPPSWLGAAVSPVQGLRRTPEPQEPRSPLRTSGRGFLFGTIRKDPRFGKAARPPLDERSRRVSGFLKDGVSDYEVEFRCSGTHAGRDSHGFR